MSRWDTKNVIEYSEVEKVKSALVGRSILSTITTGSDVNRVITFVLDDGSLLKAHATDGGCGCSNGCFTVEPGNVVQGTITNVEVTETLQTWDGTEGSEVVPGSQSEGSAVLRIFVYGDLGKQLLVESEGGDNGYYGWGFWLNVERPDNSGMDTEATSGVGSTGSEL